MPKRIRASVSQTPDEGNRSGDFFLLNVKVSLNPEDSTPPPIPANISCSLSINGAIPITPNGSRPNTQNGIDLFFSSNSNQPSVTGQPYVLSNFQNWSIADVDNTSGSVAVLPLEAVERGAVGAPTPNTAGNAISFWDRIMLFLKGLFGLKPS